MLVKNRSWSPRILTLPGAKKGETRTLALRGRASAEISEEDYESPECRRLIAQGELFVIPGATGAQTAKSKTTKKKGAEADA